MCSPIVCIDDDDDKPTDIIGDNHRVNKRQKVKKQHDEELEATQDNELKFCLVCWDYNNPSAMFTTKSCNHYTCCKDCATKHVTAKIQENILEIKCPDPDCNATIEPQICRSITDVPPDLLDRWEIGICESLIPESQKIYCPYNNCSALLIRDRCKKRIKTDCPHCLGLFCIRCKVPWHDKKTCKRYQEGMKKMKGKQSDDHVVRLAKRRRWQKCPNCHFYVERSSGCDKIVCRCRYAFCYRCGGKIVREIGHRCSGRKKTH